MSYKTSTWSWTGIKGRERRETKGRERNETQVRERREMQGRERRETQRREREIQTQVSVCRDVQGRDKREGQMETVKCGRVRESTRPPDTTLLRPLKVTRAVILVEDSPRQKKQILAEKVCLVKKRNSKCKIHC